MFKLLFLLLLLFSRPVSASLVSRQKPTYMNTIKSRFFDISASKVVPGSDDFSKRSEETIDVSITVDPVQKKHNILLALPNAMIQEIFEYLPEEYASIRLTSKYQHKSFDDFIYRITWNNFPEATEETFSLWINERSRYKLIFLSRVLYYNVKPFMPLYKLLRSKESVEIINLSEESIKLIRFLRILNIKECLKMIDSLLKLKIIQWTDIYQFLIFDNFTSVIIAWSLGMATIAREMSVYHSTALYNSMRSEHKGILAVIRGRHYALSHFFLVRMQWFAVRAMNEDKQYLDDIIAELIKAKFWDLLYQVYNLFDRHYYSHHLMIVARQGDPEGLRILKNYASNCPHGLGHIAATYGHLDFLKELDSMGLLEVSSKHLNTGDSAIHTAAFNGRTECLEFLVSRFGPDQLSVKDSSGYLPIHLASQAINSETLKVIIRLYPFYRPRFLGLFNQNMVSPLHLAVICGITDNARILLQSFPELIHFKDARKETAIHISITEASNEMLELLLDFAPPEVIRARNSDGNNALQLAVKISNRLRVSTLLATGHFTGFERNNLGLSPIYYFSQGNDNYTVMETFNLQGNDQLTEAFRIKRRKLFNFK